MKKVIFFLFLFTPFLSNASETGLAHLNSVMHGAEAAPSVTAPAVKLEAAPTPKASFIVPGGTPLAVKPVPAAARRYVNYEAVCGFTFAAIGLGVVVTGALLGGWWLVAVYLGVGIMAIGIGLGLKAMSIIS